MLLVWGDDIILCVCYEIDSVALGTLVGLHNEHGFRLGLEVDASETVAELRELPGEEPGDRVEAELSWVEAAEEVQGVA